MTRSRIIFLLAVLMPLGAEAKLYKWVDEQGNVHYSDTMPDSQAAKRGTSEMNQRGVVVRKAETPEQRAARLAEEENQRTLAIQRAEQARRDKALTDTFSKPSEIDQMRNRNVEQIDAAINTNISRRKAAESRLADYHKQSERFIKRKKALPPDLIQDIQTTEQEIVQINKQISERQLEKTNVMQRAEEDKKRLKELLSR